MHAFWLKYTKSFITCIEFEHIISRLSYSTRWRKLPFHGKFHKKSVSFFQRQKCARRFLTVRTRQSCTLHTKIMCNSIIIIKGTLNTTSNNFAGHYIKYTIQHFWESWYSWSFLTKTFRFRLNSKESDINNYIIFSRIVCLTFHISNSRSNVLKLNDVLDQYHLDCTRFEHDLTITTKLKSKLKKIRMTLELVCLSIVCYVVWQ